MQCGVYLNAGESRDYAPYLLDVQADLLADLDTRLVVPLVRAAAFGKRAGRLHPLFTVQDEEVVMATHLAAAIRFSSLGRAVATLALERSQIIAAFDVLLSGI